MVRTWYKFTDVDNAGGDFYHPAGVLRFVAYKPIMRMLDERSQRIKESMEQAEAVKEQSAKREEELKKQLEAASREGQEQNRPRR